MTQKFKLQCCAAMGALYWILALMFLMKGLIPFWFALICFTLTSSIGIPAALMLLSMRFDSPSRPSQKRAPYMQQKTYSYYHS